MWLVKSHQFAPRFFWLINSLNTLYIVDFQVLRGWWCHNLWLDMLDKLSEEKQHTISCVSPAFLIRRIVLRLHVVQSAPLSLHPPFILIWGGSCLHRDQWGLMSLCCVELKAADNKSNNNTNADITVTLKQAGAKSMDGLQFPLAGLG